MFQSVCCALLASLPLCLSESASGLSHVVKVGRNGRQVVHQATGNGKGNGGKSLWRKVNNCPFPVLSCPIQSDPVLSNSGLQPNFLFLMTNA